MTVQDALTVADLVVARKGKRLVGPLNLSLAQDGVTVFVGPNGSGKTTLLKTLHGLERPKSGTIVWRNTAPSRQAFVFQTPVMLRRSVKENLAFPLRLRQRPNDEIEQAVADWAKRIDLAKALSRPAARLSGGEKQKLALARALITQPQVLFADEPCTNLDGQATRAIETLMLEACHAGTKVLLATHDLGQVRRLASHIVFMHKGSVVEEGAARELLDSPKSSQLASYLRGDIVT